MVKKTSNQTVRKNNNHLFHKKSKIMRQSPQFRKTKDLLKLQALTYKNL